MSVSRGGPPPPVTGLSRAPVGITQVDVVETALALMDEHGVDWLTIRRLASHLGITSPAVLWHVGSKSHLWELAVERVIDAIDVTTTEHLAWTDRVAAFLRRSRDELLAHPCVIELMSRSIPVAVARWSGEALAIMQAAGFDATDAAIYARMMIWETVGLTTIEVNLRRAPVIEPLAPADPAGGGGRFRVRPELVPDPRYDGFAQTDTQKQHDAFVEVFVAGLRQARDARRRPPGG